MNFVKSTQIKFTIAVILSPAYSRVRGDTLGTYYDPINGIMDNNNIDLIINFALKTKRLLKKEDKDDTGVTYYIGSLLPTSSTSITVKYWYRYHPHFSSHSHSHIIHPPLHPQSTLTQHSPSSPQTCLHRARHYPLVG